MKGKATSLKDEDRMNLLKKKELTVQETARLLNVSRETVYKMLLRGEVSTQSVLDFMKQTKRQIPTKVQ